MNSLGLNVLEGTTDNSGTVLNKLTMSFDDDGKMTLFLLIWRRLQKKQKERLEELKEKNVQRRKKAGKRRM